MKIIFLNLRGKLINFKSPKIMGILNLTEDSFFDGGKYNSVDKSLFRTEEMINQGVDIIDVGGQSTRPGSKIFLSTYELKTIIPILEKIKEKFPEIPISVDTFWSEVAEKCLQIGVDMINDVSSGNIDRNMFKVIGKYKIPYILTHNIELPKIVQKNPYSITNEINTFFIKKINKLRSLGVHDIIIDPGFGFKKTINQNYMIIKTIQNIGFKEFPILAGISRKSMIYKILNSNPNNVLYETSALHLFLLLNNISILRVHDIIYAKRIIKIFKKFKFC